MTVLRRAIARGAVLALVLLWGASSPMGAQEVPVDREQLTRYARAHVAMGAARDEFHAKIARIHDDVGLGRAREEMDERIARILVENEITSEQYGVLTLLISQNETVRAVFEEIERELREGGGLGC
jgi:polyphosphate kinase